MAQAICYEYMTTRDFDKHISELKEIYKKKCNLMLEQIAKNFSSKIKYTKPEGGLFIWCTLPEGSDMMGFCAKAVQEYKIAVVPGNARITSYNVCYTKLLRYKTGRRAFHLVYAPRGKRYDGILCKGSSGI